MLEIRAELKRQDAEMRDLKREMQEKETESKNRRLLLK